MKMPQNDHKLEPWKTLDQKVVLDTPWFKIRHEHLLTPTGAKAEFYIHSNNDAVLCFCVDDQERVLIERQYRPAIERVSIDYPAGRIESDDASTQAAIRRELREEVGFTATDLTRLAIIDKDPGWSSARVHIFLARGQVDQAPQPDATEGIVASFVPRAEILKLISDGQLCCSFCVTATFFAFQALGWPITRQ